MNRGCRFAVSLAALMLWQMAMVSAQAGAAAESHWSFLPVTRPQVPASASTDRNAIDSFIGHRLKMAGIRPSAETDEITLLRRVSLDLTGLPPTPEDVDAWQRDTRPDRYERLVDRLLASPHYGEKWAVPWLDLCHYADTDGYLTDQPRPVAWRYRSWLVDALNSNLPFDEFTIHQIAGDLLPEATMSQRLATGFLRQTLSNREGGAEPEEFRVKQIIDRTEMVGAIWLGLTVGCARCHDHKYDPLEQQEFFQLYACLNNADEVNVDAPLPEERAAFLKSRKEYDDKRRALTAVNREPREALQKQWEQRCLQARDNPGQDHVWDRQWELLGLVWGGHLGEGQLEGQEIVRLPWNLRTVRQQDDLLDYFLASGSIVDPQRYQELELGALKDQLQQLKQQYPRATRAPVMQASLHYRETRIHEAGDFRDPGKPVNAAAPDCLPAWQDSEDRDPRLALAQWLVSPEHPLTARVTVNRMWEQFFGRGLVLTTEDFGYRGTPPSHPDLLDWLAAELMASGWDVKAMHRLIVCSSTYRRSSEVRPELRTEDPDNVLLARQNSLRLSAEAIRDAGLAVSGLLHRRIGGPSVFPAQPSSVTAEAYGGHEWRTSAAPDCYRRGLYTYRIRTTPFAQGVTFDAPNPNEICTRRMRSNTPLQALTLLNDPVFYEMAQALADQVLRPDVSDEVRLQQAFVRCLTREPSPDELQQLQDYLAAQRAEFESDPAAVPARNDSFTSAESAAEQAAWTGVCSVLLNLHEFITRD